MFRIYNRYDKMLFLLIVSLVCGNIGGALQAPRILAILFSPAFFHNLTSCDYFLSRIKTCGLFFLLYSGVSILWSPAENNEAIIGFLYNIVHMLLFLEVIVFSKKANVPLKVITTSFLIAFAISAVIATWELSTDNHLSFSKIEEAKKSNNGFEVYIRYFASVTFYNLNTYVTFICFLFPYLFYGIIDRANRYSIKILYSIAVIIAIILILYNGSRGGLLTVVFMLCIFYFMIPKKGVIIHYSVAALIGFSYILYKYGANILLTLSMRIDGGNFRDESRFSIWQNVLKVASDYVFLGSGTNGLSDAMKQYAHGGITVAHNFFLELFAQYGFVFFMLYIYWLIKIIRQNRTNVLERKIIVNMIVITLPIVFIINSIYITQPMLWVSMATLFIFTNYEQIRLSN